VTATLALVVALGGGAYAAVSLPAGSVGTQQLRDGAVTPSRLGFALTSRVVVPGRKVVSIPGEQCITTGPPGIPAPCAPPLPVTLVATTIRLARSANILLLANTNLVNDSRGGQTAQVQLYGRIDGRNGTQLPNQDSFNVASNSQMAGFYQGVLANVPPGRHALEVFATDGGPTVTAGNIELIAIALPPN
jgi:hypothetical protein